MSMSYWEMLRGDVEYDHLQILEEVASGSFGTIYKAQYNDKYVAVKELFFTENEQVLKLVVREVQALKYVQHLFPSCIFCFIHMAFFPAMHRSLDHPNIVKYYGLSVHLTGTYLVMEFVEGGDLR